MRITSVGSRPSKNGHSDIENTTLRNVMQNHTNMCIALYSLQNAFTYTSSFIPSSFPSIYRKILYIQQEPRLTPRARKMSITYKSLLLKSSQFNEEDWKVNSHNIMCKEVQRGIPGLWKWHRGTKTCNEVREKKSGDAWAES